MGCILTLAPSATAQGNQGNNDVYSSAGGETGSAAFIDALLFLQSKGGTALDICDAIYTVLTSTNPTYPQAGAVIDTRGISGSNLTCTKGTPWSENNVYVSKPSTILLPAGVITIPTTWILPNSTRVIGEGSTNPYTLPATAPQPQTVIQACTSNTCTNGFSGSTMIQFGDSHCPTPGFCTRLTLEDVTLNGSGLGINGIVNANSQELSYAENVVMYQLLGIGLQIPGSAENSRQYSNSAYDGAPAIPAGLS
jgi:hypothetical protein